jgi:hypothetical protein
MNVSSVAAAVSAQALASTQMQASLLVLKKSIDLQQTLALQLLQAMPQPAPSGSGVGGTIDVYA